MNQRTDFPPSFHLGPWLVQPDLNRISGPDGDQRIEPLVMRVLLCLAEKPGEVWSRQGLLDEVWNESVVGEEILTRAISELRRVFGDKARDPRFIETIRNHGYRLIETPRPVLEKTPLPTPKKDPERPAPPKTRGPGRRPVGILAGVGLLVLAVVLIWSRGDFSGKPTPEESQFGGAVPLTSFPGREWHPAFSADGTRIAFVWSGPEDQATDIYVKQRNSESLLRLTTTEAWVAWPAWSPDGQTVAFVHWGPDGSTLCLVPSLGGPIQDLLNVASWVEGLDYSPDGKSLVFAARDSGSGKFGIYQLDLGSLEVRLLDLKGDNRAGDFQPRFSPDGLSLAWVGVGFDGNSRLYHTLLAGSKIHRVGRDFANLQGLDFSADGQSLIFSASPDGVFHLWRVHLKDGPLARAQLLPTPGDFAWNPNIARQKGDLVFEQVQADQDIWQIRIVKQDPWEMQTSALLESTRWEFEAVYSPDGSKIAFISARSGRPEVWLADKNGLNPRKLTQLGPAGLNNLRWSPDGQTLAFNALRQGRSAVLTLAIRGGEPQSLTPDGTGELFFSWSHQGKSLLFGLQGDQGWEIWRRNLKDGRSQIVTSVGGLAATESADGRSLYLTRPDQSGLWMLPLDEQGQGVKLAEPVLVLEELSSQDRHNWVLNQGRVFWIFRTAGTAMLAITDLASKQAHLLTEMPDWSGTALAVSPDGLRILYGKTSRLEGDLMVLEGPELEE